MNLSMSVQQLGRTVLSVPESVLFGIERKICQMMDTNDNDDPAGQSSSIPEHLLKRYNKLKNKDAEERKWNYTGVNNNYDAEEYYGVNIIADDDDQNESSRRTDQATSSKAVLTAQKIGRTVMSVPDKLLLRYNNNNNNNPDDDGTAVVDGKDGSAVESQRKHSILCQELLLHQKGRVAVQEIKDQCLQDMEDHLNWYLFDNDTTDDTLELTTTSYEQWIQSIHPDNVVRSKNQENNHDHKKENNDDTNNHQIEIDPRFYLEASHHLQLWNGSMKNLERTESIIEAKSM